MNSTKSSVLGQCRTNWTSTSLQSSTRLLIWLQQCHLVKETEVDCLQLVCFICCGGFCKLMYTSITGLRGAYFSKCGILCSGRRSSDAAVPWNARVSEIESESAVCYWVCFVSTEQWVCVWQQHLNNSAACAIMKKKQFNINILSFKLIWLIWLYDATVKKSLCSWANSKIQHNQKTIQYKKA